MTEFFPLEISTTPDGAWKTNSIRHEYPPSFYQPAFNSITRQLPATAKESKKPPKSPQGFVQMSASDFELQEKIFNIWDANKGCDEQCLAELITPKKAEVMGALMGIEGHFIDNICVELFRHWVLNTSKEDLCVTSTQLSLKPHEKALVDAIASPILAHYSKYNLADIPYLADLIRLDWRESLEFILKQTRTTTSSNAIRKTGKIYNQLQGSVWGEKDIQDFWNSEDQSRFASRVLSVYQSVIDEYEGRDLFNHKRHRLPFETDWNRAKSLITEQNIIFHVEFPFNGVKIQYFLRPDYIVTWPLDDGTKGIVVVDTKFGNMEDIDGVGAQIQRLLYCAAVKNFVVGRLPGQAARPKIKLDEFDPYGVGMLYKVFDTKSLKPSYRYINVTPEPKKVPELLEEMQVRAVFWDFYKNDYKRVRALRKEAVVMPYIPKSLTIDTFQGRLDTIRSNGRRRR